MNWYKLAKKKVYFEEIYNNLMNQDDSIINRNDSEKAEKVYQRLLDSPIWDEMYEKFPDSNGGKDTKGAVSYYLINADTSGFNEDDIVSLMCKVHAGLT